MKVHHRNIILQSKSAYVTDFVGTKSMSEYI